ncbi:MAG: SMC family ATPase, partial [Anaerolineales bacterium]|nr:SMC family ATPase [Anaerolineales bacterium]
MVPQRLELTNFLSYRDTAVLDFTGIHLACISGLNGAGKSSLLDAITWALFGKSRSKSDDDLVNRLAALNGDTAEVRFTFELEGAAYRVIRQKRAGRSAALEFQIAAGDDRWKPLSEGKLRETQTAVESLLRMNYEAFTNASFLLQGHADEFTTKTPNRRKEILADLLGVNLWDRYRDAAAGRRKLAEGRLQLLDGQLAEIESELAEEAERKETLAAAQAELAAITEKRALQEQLLQQMRQTESAVKQQRQLVHNLATNLERARRTHAGLQETRTRRQQEHDAHAATLAAAAEIEASFAAWQAADATLQQWQETADSHNRLVQARRPFELAVTRERSRLLQQQTELTARANAVAAAQTEREAVAATITTHTARLTDLHAQLAALAAQEQAWHAARTALQQLENDRTLLQQQIDQLQAQAHRVAQLRQEHTAVSENAASAAARLADLAAQVAALGAQRQQHATALADKNNLETEQPRLRADMDKLRERLDRLSAETGGSCPLCGQPLSDDHRQTVLAELETDGAALGDRFR